MVRRGQCDIRIVNLALSLYIPCSCSQSVPDMYRPPPVADGGRCGQDVAPSDEERDEGAGRDVGGEDD